MQLMSQELDENGNPAAKPLSPELAGMKPPAVVYPDAPPPAAAPEPEPAAPVVAAAPAPVMPAYDIAKTTTTSTSAPVANPGEKATQAALDGDTARLQDLAQQEGKLLEAKAQIDEQRAATADKIATDSEQRKVQYASAIEKATQEADAEIDARYTEMKSFKFRDYWEDQSTGDKVLAAIAIGLGGLGAGMTGKGGNGALDVINNAITRDSERQKSQFEQLKATLGEAQALKASKLNGMSNVEAAFALSDAGKYDAALKKAESMLAKQGVPAAEIQTNQVVAGLTQKRNTELLKAQQSLRATKTTQVQEQIVKAQPVPGATPKDAQEEIQANVDFKAFKERRAARDNFKGFVKTGATGAALADFLATGMKQGSFGPEMINILSKRSLIDQAGEVVRNKVEGDYSPALMRTIQDGLNAQYAVSERNAKPVITRARQLGKERFGDANYFLGEAEAPQKLSVDDQAALNWATSNPNDPRAAEIKRSLGQ